MKRLTNKAKLAATTATIAGLTVLLQGCFQDDYFTHRDTVSLGAGDAVAVNQVTQTIDPWPPYAKNTDINLDGRRARIAIERYQQNKTIPPKGLSTSEVVGADGPDPNGAAQVTN